MDRLPSASPDPFRLAPRVAGIEPFWVMECAKAADTSARSPACDPAQGGEPMIYEDAAAYQALDSVGVMLKGTDANGNALSFTTLVHFSQETNP